MISFGISAYYNCVLYTCNTIITIWNKRILKELIDKKYDIKK